MCFLVGLFGKEELIKMEEYFDIYECVYIYYINICEYYINIYEYILICMYIYI